MVPATLIVFGSNGMLGNAVSSYLERCMSPSIRIIRLTRIDYDILIDSESKLDTLLTTIKDNNDNSNIYVLNAAGIIPQRHTIANNSTLYMKINAEFPWVLARLCQKRKIKMMHASTDCVFSGKKGQYYEDDLPDESNIYGKSKGMGEPFTLCMVIRTSIIGHESKGTQNSLLEWVLSHRDSQNSIDGWTKSRWNGITCLEYAKIIYKLLTSETVLYGNGIRHIFSPDPIITKYDLLKKIKNTYKLNQLTIQAVSVGDVCDKSLSTKNYYNFLFRLSIPSIDMQINEQKTFYYPDL